MAVHLQRIYCVKILWRHIVVAFVLCPDISSGFHPSWILCQSILLRIITLREQVQTNAALQWQMHSCKKAQTGGKEGAAKS